MRKLYLSFILLALTAAVFAQSNDRIDETNIPEIDNLSGLKPDGEDLAPDYGVTDMSNTATQPGGVGGTDESLDHTIPDGNINFERHRSIENSTIYPNPATDHLTVTTEVETGTIRVLNLLGQEMSAHNITNTITNLDITELNEGIYFISIFR